MQISTPSKTFLLGEYSVLKGGAGLLINTEPRFVLKAIERNVNENFQHLNIALQSPAAKYIQDNIDFFSLWNIEMHDPHNNLGGFGASSAQFLTVLSLHKNKLSNKELVLEFHKYSNFETSLKPSGYDLISQKLGGLAFISNTLQSETLQWPFNDYSLYLYRTGNKLQTHEHLKKLENKNFDKLDGFAEKAKTALLNKDSSIFSEAINSFYSTLLKHDLVDTKTQALINEIKNQAGVVAVKGCGAMGADVIVVMSTKPISTPLELVATSQNISEGLRYDL